MTDAGKAAPLTLEPLTSGEETEWRTWRLRQLCAGDRLLVKRLFITLDLARSALDQANARVGELEGLVYVPGLWRCPKCKFSLLQRNLNAADGTVTARDQPGDKCPNCDSPLWRVSERDAGNEMIDRAEEAFAEKRTAEAHATATEAALRKLNKAAWQVLDDFQDGKSCCQQAKDQLAQAYLEARPIAADPDDATDADLPSALAAPQPKEGQ